MEAYEDLFRTAFTTGDPTTLVDALRGSARVLRCLGRYEEAEEHAGASWQIADLNGLRQSSARALNVLAMIRYSENDLDAARALYTHALDGARDARDDELIGLICQNLGIIENITGSPLNAGAFYLECLAAAVRSGSERAMAPVYNNLGMVSTDLHDWMEAEVYFARGIELADLQGDTNMLALLHANRAEPMIHTGEVERAREELTLAEGLAARTQNDKILVDTHRFRAIIARGVGDHAAAEAHLSRAIGLAATTGADLERAEALEELAWLRKDQGNAADSLTLLKAARSAFAALGASRDVERTLATLADWETAELLVEWESPPPALGGLVPDVLLM